MPTKSNPSRRGGLLRVAGALLAALLWAAGSLYPQGRPAQRPKAGEAEAGAKSGRKPSFGVDVNLVIMNTAVVDPQGRFINGLGKEDFAVYEDRVLQKIESFKQEDIPISLGIVMDTSGSMKRKIQAVGQAALLLVQSSNPEDEIFIVTFNTDVELLEDYTSDLDDLKEALDNVTVGGGTALYDAVFLGVEKAQKGRKLKKAVVLISDGEDRDSRYKLEEVLDKIKEADVQVHAIGLLDPEEKPGLFGGIFNKSRQKSARQVLEKIAEETGGKAIFPQDVSQVNEIIKSIAHELRNQYSIGYLSSNDRKDGTWRAVRVTLTRPDAKHKVRTRAGYYAPKQ